tara:strand:- start:17 stop:247 length:231 start_codon:yes stop_codon:yes gene_type:complete
LRKQPRKGGKSPRLSRLRLVVVVFPPDLFTSDDDFRRRPVVVVVVVIDDDDDDASSVKIFLCGKKLLTRLRERERV